jgi:hypothetical protein
MINDRRARLLPDGMHRAAFAKGEGLAVDAPDDETDERQNNLMTCDA